MVTEFASGHLNSCGKVQFQQIKKTVTGDNEMKGGGVKMIDIENCIDTLNISKVKRQQDNLSVLSKGSQLNIQILRAVPVLRRSTLYAQKKVTKLTIDFGLMSLSPGIELLIVLHMMIVSLRSSCLLLFYGITRT